MGIYKSRVMRLCGTLEHMGYLLRDRRSGSYRLGMRLLSLGRAYERTNPLLSTIRPVLESLYERTGQSAFFYVLDGLKRVCIARVGDPRTFRLDTQEGIVRDLHYGSTGKVLLAFGSQDLREAFFARMEEYPRLTPHTITDPKVFWDELKEVREKGYARSSEERVLGAAGMAAPVFFHSGEPAGALAVAGDASVFTEEFLTEAVPILLEGARSLSLKLGFRPPDNR
jgi:DNA-binding IclR family transcriptional regulator